MEVYGGLMGNSWGFMGLRFVVLLGLKPQHLGVQGFQFAKELAFLRPNQETSATCTATALAEARCAFQYTHGSVDSSVTAEEHLQAWARLRA